MNKYGSEPVLDYDSPDENFDHEWYQWMCRHSTEDLEQLVSGLGNWVWAEHPEMDPDAMQVKYELAVDELAKRKD